MRYSKQYPKNQKSPLKAMMHILTDNETIALMLGSKPDFFEITINMKVIMSVVTMAIEFTKAWKL